MVAFGSMTKEPVIVGQVKHVDWIDSEGEEHSDEQANYTFEKAFIIGMHSLCPVFAAIEESSESITFADLPRRRLSMTDFLTEEPEVSEDLVFLPEPEAEF